MMVLSWSVLLLASSAAGQSISPSNADLLRQADEAYAAGLAARANAASARPQFSSAAEIYDHLWQQGTQNPQLAAQRARAHLLAGQLGHAVLAYREGVRLFPGDRNLANELKYARAQVSYPNDGTLAEQTRQPEPWFLFRLLSLASLIWWALGLYGVGCLLLARAWMKRSQVKIWLGSSLIGTALIAVATISIQGTGLRDDPIVVIGEQGTPLYCGNGEHYPLRIERLPAGFEAQILTQRGEWLQIQLGGGVVGWIPASQGLVVQK